MIKLIISLSSITRKEVQGYHTYKTRHSLPQGHKVTHKIFINKQQITIKLLKKNPI